MGSRRWRETPQVGGWRSSSKESKGVPLAPLGTRREGFGVSAL